MKRLIAWLLSPSYHALNARVCDLLRHEERILNRREANAEGWLPDWCTCPDDCDCDGRLVCGDRAGETFRWCNETPGHDGWHVSGNHRWADPR